MDTPGRSGDTPDGPPASRRLLGRRALVTGGTTGLGFAIAERFLREGASVVITGRNEGLGASAQRSLGDRALFVAADAADEEAVRASVDRAVEYLGGLQVLINNAGVGVVARLVDTPTEDFDRTMTVNVRGCFLYARLAYPHLAHAGGAMVHISSDAGVIGEQSIGAYSVSKAALIMLSKMLAVDGGADRVRSNCICPGDILPGMRHMGPPGRDARTDDPASDWPIPPIGRLGRGGDVADAAVFLASDESSFCTGAVLLVDGGMRAGFRMGPGPGWGSPAG
jgi:NAD(P)-dependent dehydrogenase (short-subunit alcohol dehydrogenase family)